MKKELTKLNRAVIHDSFKDVNISQLLCEQLAEVYQDRLCGDYIYTLRSENQHLYLEIDRGRTRKTESSESDLNEASTYCIRITRAFPVQGVRIYLLRHCVEPKIYDARDLMYEIMGDVWSYKKRLLQVVSRIESFEQKLILRNEKYLSMQQTGLFPMGDIFTREELKRFSSLILFEDLTQQNGALVGVAQTHLLTFKALQNCKGKGSGEPNIYQLTRACELQCINCMQHNQSQKTVTLTLYKYRNIKSFNEFEQITRKYKLQDSEHLIARILKQISKYQKVEMDLETSSTWDQVNGFSSLSTKLEENLQLRKAITSKSGNQDRSKALNKLSQNYESIIEFYSSRGSPYYLIYVNKLNRLFSQQI